MTNRYMKRFSTSSLIRKMQMKTARRYHRTLIGWLLSIKKKKIANVGKDVEKVELLCIDAKNVKWCGLSQHNHFHQTLLGQGKS